MKNDSDKPASPGRRAAAYWFKDGFPDILLGTTLVVFGGLGLAWCIHSPKSAGRPDFFFLAAGQLLFYWKGRPAVDLLKSRITYPRTGYVQPPQDVPERPLAQPSTPISLSLEPGPPTDENVTHFNTRTVYGVFYWCLLILVGLNPWRHWYTPLAMLALAILLYAWNRRSERPYRWWPALILAFTGPAVMLVNTGPLVEPLLLPLVAGAWLAAHGACTLAGYLRANPYPQAAQEVRA